MTTTLRDRAYLEQLSDEELLKIGQAVHDVGELFAELLGAVQALEWKCMGSDDDDEKLELAQVVAKLGARIRTQALASQLVEQGNNEFEISELLVAANWALTPRAMRRASMAALEQLATAAPTTPAADSAPGVDSAPGGTP